MLKERLEAVTVCVGYSDFLRETAHYNAAIFDRWVIATTPQDESTREVCRQYSLPVLLTEDGKGDGGDGGEFKKGRIIERALRLLSADGWRVHIDADIVLPSRTRHFLEIAELNRDKVYGVDRLMVRSYEKWKELEQSGWLTMGHHDYHNRVRVPDGITIGSRWADINCGFAPLGFFQLWNASQDLWRGTRIRPYPEMHNDACRTDVQFSLQWDRRQRELIPEILCVHLESKASLPLGINWRGRKSPPFGPPEDKLAKLVSTVNPS
jgi:hypothetical protein